jgi:hypothetical protein
MEHVKIKATGLIRFLQKEYHLNWKLLLYLKTSG